MLTSVTPDFVLSLHRTDGGPCCHAVLSGLPGKDSLPAPPLHAAVGRTTQHCPQTLHTALSLHVTAAMLAALEKVQDSRSAAAAEVVA